MIRRVATLPSTIAIHGESGVGKELVARAIHNLSDRSKKPFVAINCGGIPENLLESELFGYKKGAFTGALEDKEGLFVVADGGSLFLDEIGEMPLKLQVRLLRVLDSNTVMPVGGTSEVEVDVRLISATNRDLAQMVEKGAFRKDLYYRLNVIPVTVPPLRHRTGDIPLFARHFVAVYAKSLDRGEVELPREAEEALERFNWPGNVRELANVIERAVALCRGNRIELWDLPAHIQNYVPAGDTEHGELPAEGVQLEDLIAKMETRFIKQALEKARYSQKQAAQLLGLTPRSLRYRLQKYGLSKRSGISRQPSATKQVGAVVAAKRRPTRAVVKVLDFFKRRTQGIRPKG